MQTMDSRDGGDFIAIDFVYPFSDFYLRKAGIFFRRKNFYPPFKARGGRGSYGSARKEGMVGMQVGNKNAVWFFAQKFFFAQIKHHLIIYKYAGMIGMF